MAILQKSGVLSGISALSHRSMLQAPDVPVYAVSVETWKIVLTREVSVLSTWEGADVALEIWNYDPKLLAKEGIADPFSLFLSLQACEEERVNSALEAMMEKVKW